MSARAISSEREGASTGNFYNLGDLIDKSRALHKIAVIDLGGETAPCEFSFDTLDRMANGVARGLLARGLARGERVALLSANRAEYLAPITASCAPGSLQYRSIVNFRGRSSIWCCGTPARAWYSAIHRDGLTVLRPCPWLSSATPGPRVLRVFLTTGHSLRCSRRRQNLPCSYTPRVQLGSRRAWCYRITVTSGSCTRAWVARTYLDTAI